MGYRHLGKYQHHPRKLPPGRDLRFRIGLLGRRRLRTPRRPTQTLVEHWNGTSWAIIPSANTSSTQNNDLYGVTCVSASNCRAVGYHSVGTAHQTLIEQWDGTSWSIVASPNISGAQHNFLEKVACNSASDCWAVGEYFDTSNSSLSNADRAVEWECVVNRRLAQRRQRSQRTLWCDMHIGVAVLGCGLLLQRRCLSNADRAVEWGCVVNCPFGQHQHYAR